MRSGRPAPRLLLSYSRSRSVRRPHSVLSLSLLCLSLLISALNAGEEEARAVFEGRAGGLAGDAMFWGGGRGSRLLSMLLSTLIFMRTRPPCSCPLPYPDGATWFAGESLDREVATVSGAIAFAMHTRLMAVHYGVCYCSCIPFHTFI